MSIKNSSRAIAKTFVRKFIRNFEQHLKRFAQIQPATTAHATTWKILGAVCCSLLAFESNAIAAATPPAFADAEVLGIYIQVNGFDVETALLGRAQGSTSAVRALGNQVATDHLQVRQTAFDIAAQCNVSPLLPASRESVAIEHGRAMAKLSGLKGAAFDQAYLQHEVAFHRAAIEAVEKTLEPAATCAALKKHFRDILPALKHHLEQTEILNRKLTAR